MLDVPSANQANMLLPFSITLQHFSKLRSANLMRSVASAGNRGFSVCRRNRYSRLNHKVSSTMLQSGKKNFVVCLVEFEHYVVVKTRDSPHIALRTSCTAFGPSGVHFGGVCARDAQREGAADVGGGRVFGSVRGEGRRIFGDYGI